MMNLLERVNQEPYKKMYGRVVRLLRNRQKLTLRTLSDQVNFSHAFLRKVEMGQTAISAELFNKINSVLEIDLVYDYQKEIDFFENFKEYHNAHLYLDILTKRQIYERIINNAAFHSNSLWMVEYLMVQMGETVSTPSKDKPLLHQLYNDLTSVESLLDDSMRQLYLIYKGSYYYLINDFKRNRHTFIQAYDIAPNGRYASLSLYFLGLAYANTFNLNRSTRLLSEAKHLFSQQNNEMRVFVCDMYITFNEILRNHLEGAESKLLDGIDIAKQSALDVFISSIRLYLIIYYIKTDQLKKAQDVLDHIKKPRLNLCFFDMYVHYKLNDTKRVMAINESVKPLMKRVMQHEFVHYYGIQAIIANTQNWPQNDKQKVLENFYKEAKRQKAYMQLDIAYQLYVEFLKQERKYKAAFDLTKDMVDITKGALD